MHMLISHNLRSDENKNKKVSLSLLVAFFLFDSPLLAAISMSLHADTDADRTSSLLSCFKSNKVVLVRDYDYC